MPVIHLGSQQQLGDVDNILAQLEALDVAFELEGPPPRRSTPATVVGGIVLPVVLALSVLSWLAPRVLSPARFAALHAWGSALRQRGGSLLRPIAGVNWGLLREHVTRVCVYGNFDIILDHFSRISQLSPAPHAL